MLTLWQRKKLTSLCYSNWARNECERGAEEGKKYASVAGRETEDERGRERAQREGPSCRRAKAPRLGTTAITAAAKTLWIHLHCLMETSQWAFEPSRRGPGGCAECVCALPPMHSLRSILIVPFCRILTTMNYGCNDIWDIGKVFSYTNEEEPEELGTLRINKNTGEGGDTVRISQREYCTYGTLR